MAILIPGFHQLPFHLVAYHRHQLFQLGGILRPEPAIAAAAEAVEIRIGGQFLPALQPLGMGNAAESGGGLPVTLQSLDEILLSKGRTLTLDSPVAQVAILLRLAWLMGEAGVEQGVGFLKLPLVQLHPAQKTQSPGIVWLNNQRPGQIIPAFMARLQPLDMAEAVTVGLPVVGRRDWPAKADGQPGPVGIGIPGLDDWLAWDTS